MGRRNAVVGYTMRIKRAVEELSFFTLPLWEVKVKKK
jgi:hypothetical protein